MTEKKSPVISFKDFSFQYRAQKKPTLTGINLDIYPGEKVLIAGPSGSGKSTLAGCVNGLNPFSNPGECKGTLTVDGVDAPHSSIFELSAHVGTVLQDPDGQFIGLTVGEDIAFALENSCTPQNEMHKITRHAAELVGIENHLDYAPHELSGGQKQRVSLAGVMVDQVKILLFDEPLANLDPAAGKQAIELIDEIQKNKDAIEQYKFEASRAEREGDYGKVAELRYGKIKEAEQRIEVVKKKLADMKHGESLIREEVTSDDIAAVVSKWTGIPVNRMMQSERTKLLHLEEELHKRVVGQEVAIAALADAVRRNRAGLQDARRPIGSFIFLGTTGVGKTELAKALAEFLFDDETQMTRIDMSEYQEKHSVSRLIGAPPGYIGYDEGGQLTEAVRRKPYSVVLLDEIEKAHPDVFNILLQVLDDGRLTDNKGRTVDFKNTIVIMTSNIGAHIIQERLKDLNEKNRDQVLETTNNEVYELLKQTIRPEFLNRIDEVIMFTPLQKNEIVDIVRLQVKSLQKMLANNSITIEVTDKAVEWIAQEGYDPQFGARPVKRVIQRNLLNDLSKQILAEKITKDNQIVIDVKDDHIVFTNK